MQINVKWDLGSEIFPFGEEVYFEHYFDNKVLFKNNKPIVFQLFLKLTEFQTTEKTIGLLFSNNILFLKYSSKAVH